MCFETMHISKVYSPIHKYITQLVDMVTEQWVVLHVLVFEAEKESSFCVLQPNDIDPTKQLISEYSNRDHPGSMKNLSKLNGFW